MDKSHSLSSPIVVCWLKANKDLFHPKEDNEELFSLEVQYLNAIDALMYLANCTRADITFSINLLARYSSAPSNNSKFNIFNPKMKQSLAKVENPQIGMCNYRWK